MIYSGMELPLYYVCNHENREFCTRGSGDYTCSFVCMAAATLSPVSIAVLIPNDLSSLIASATPDRQVSESIKIPAAVPPQYTYPTDFPSLAKPSRVGTEHLETLIIRYLKLKVRKCRKTLPKK